MVLIVDGQKSHTHNLAALELATKQGAIMLSLPPHTSHLMQPLDLTFFKPLKTFYYQAIDDWLRCHPERAVTMYQISMLFGQIYGKAASVVIATKRFEKGGIFPFNSQTHDESDFFPAKV